MMPKCIPILLCLVSSTLLVSCVDLYVALPASGGNDANNGTLSEPFATLSRAQAYIRSNQISGATVWIRGGKYFLSSTLAFTSVDLPTTYRAYYGEQVILSGGKPVGVGSASNDARLPAASRGTVLEIDLSAAGITDFGQLPTTTNSISLQLTVQNTPFYLSRYPNKVLGSIYPVNSTWIFIPYAQASTTSRALPFPPEISARVATWTHSPYPAVHGYLAYFWRDECVPFNLTTSDLPHHIFNLSSNTVYGIAKGGVFNVYNLIEELDQPGEWWFDTVSKHMFYYPFPGVSYGDQDVIISMLNNLITGNTVHNITFQDVIIQDTRSDAVSITGVSNAFKLIGCTVRNTGHGSGVILNGYNHLVANSEVYNTGQYGISVAGPNIDRQTLTPANNLVNNSKIHDFGLWQETYHPAINFAGVGNRVAYCELYNNPHMAVGYSGNNHIIEYNYIHDLVYGTYDAGAIYSGRDLSVRGIVIRYNLFANIGTNTEPSCNSVTACLNRPAVYADDHLSGNIIFGNIFYRCQIGFYSNCGRDHQLKNNMFINTDTCTRFNGADDFGTGNATIYSTLFAVPFTSLTWTTAYPALINILNNNPGYPAGNVATNNIISLHTPFAYHSYYRNDLENWFSCTTSSPPFWDVSIWNGVGLNLVNDTPGFVNPNGFDPSDPTTFQLAENALAFTDLPTFQPLPLSSIGTHPVTTDNSEAVRATMLLSVVYVLFAVLVLLC